MGCEVAARLGNETQQASPQRPLHPFGHGKAMYFYSLLVSVYIFGIGGALAIHHGITALRNP